MNRFLEDFRHTVREGAERLLALTEDETSWRPAPGKWSAREVVGHLIDSASNNHRRFVMAQLEDDLVFPGYDQDDWVARQRYQKATMAELVELWRAFNLQLVRVIEAISDEDLTRSRQRHNFHRIAFRTIPEDRPATLEYFIRDYLDHLKYHLEQIETLLESQRQAR